MYSKTATRDKKGKLIHQVSRLAHTLGLLQPLRSVSFSRHLVISISST